MFLRVLVCECCLLFFFGLFWLRFVSFSVTPALVVVAGDEYRRRVSAHPPSLGQLGRLPTKFTYAYLLVYLPTYFYYKLPPNALTILIANRTRHPTSLSPSPRTNSSRVTSRVCSSLSRASSRAQRRRRSSSEVTSSAPHSMSRV